MVLFLFVVMMLDIDTGRLRENFWSYLPVASFVGVIIVLEMAAVLWRSFLSFDTQAVAAGNIGGTKELGILIFTKYVYGFEIAAAILLVAIIAAVALTLRKRKDTKHFDPADAVRVKRNDRLKIVKIAPVTTRGQVDAGSVENKETP
jgi:NADH-quinone oxidoreductase subunit J